MGYLDGSTVTVDAVLTKKGRQIIAEGGSLDVQYFTLSDTGVDYTLWNEDHASGSAYYGESIENTPQTEAISNAAYSFRNKLVTLSRDTISMPTLTVNPNTHTFDTTDPLNMSVQLVGYSPPSAGGGGSGLHLVVPDINVAQCTNGTQIDITGNAMSFVYDQDIASARVYEISGNNPTATITPQTNLLSATPMTLTFIDILTGAYTQATITVNADLVARTQRVPTKDIIGG